MTSTGDVLRFDEFMEMALYGPDGFYTVGGNAGRRGDFITSPEVGPLFGTVVARALDDEWERLDRPTGFTVVEVGAGPGTLARSILAAAPACLRGDPANYVAVETSPRQRAMHPAGIRSMDATPSGPITGVVLANELLDNLPFRLLVHDGGWREACAALERDRWVERLAPLDKVPVWLPAHVPHGSRAPWQEGAAQWLGDALDRLAAGRLIAIDYVTPRTAELSVRPWRDWLRTYRGHERGGHYLASPGSQDITVQVCLDQLSAAVGEPDAIRSQAQFLKRWGIDDLVEEGRAQWAATAARPDLAAMRGRSRVRESEALLDPTGLGGFLVLEWAR